MSEKITDYTLINTLPADTLFDVSIDVDSTPLTRAIRLGDLQSSLGVFYQADGQINDPLREVDLNSNSLLIRKGRIGFGDPPVPGSESYLIRAFTGGEDILRVVGGISGSDEYFSIAEDGFVSVNNASLLSNEKLGVSGNIAVSGVPSFGGAPISGSQISAPSGWLLNFGNISNVFDNSSTNSLSFRCRDSRMTARNQGNTHQFLTVEDVSRKTSLSINSEIAADFPSLDSNPTNINMISTYWDGASSQEAEFNINSVPTALTGDLITTFKSSGNDSIAVDSDSTAGNTRLFIYDVDNGSLERVSVGVSDSGGVGFKVLRIPN